MRILSKALLIVFVLSSGFVCYGAKKVEIPGELTQANQHLKSENLDDRAKALDEVVNFIKSNIGKLDEKNIDGILDYFAKEAFSTDMTHLKPDPTRESISWVFRGDSDAFFYKVLDFQMLSVLLAKERDRLKNIKPIIDRNVKVIKTDHPNIKDPEKVIVEKRRNFYRAFKNKIAQLYEALKQQEKEIEHEKELLKLKDEIAKKKEIKKDFLLKIIAAMRKVFEIKQEDLKSKPFSVAFRRRVDETIFPIGEVLKIEKIRLADQESIQVDSALDGLAKKLQDLKRFIQESNIHDLVGLPADLMGMVSSLGKEGREYDLKWQKERREERLRVLRAEKAFSKNLKKIASNKEEAIVEGLSWLKEQMTKADDDFDFNAVFVAIKKFHERLPSLKTRKDEVSKLLLALFSRMVIWYDKLENPKELWHAVLGISNVLKNDYGVAVGGLLLEFGRQLMIKVEIDEVIGVSIKTKREPRVIMLLKVFNKDFFGKLANISKGLNNLYVYEALLNLQEVFVGRLGGESLKQGRQALSQTISVVLKNLLQLFKQRLALSDDQLKDLKTKLIKEQGKDIEQIFYSWKGRIETFSEMLGKNNYEIGQTLVQQVKKVSSKLYEKILKLTEEEEEAFGEGERGKGKQKIGK